MVERNIHITMALEKTGDTLVIGYTVENREQLAIYVTDVYLKRNGTATHVANDIVPLAIDSGKIVFRSRLVPLTQSVTSYAPPSAYVTKVNAGEKYTASFRLALPLKYVDRSMPEPAKETTHFKTVAVELGLIPDDKKLNASLQKIDDKEVFLLNNQAWNLQFVYTQEFKNANVPVLVLNY